MTVNLKTPRPDVIYLRRRLKVGEKLPSVEVPKNNFLKLNAPEDTVPIVEKPKAEGRVTLSLDHPVVRLNARQSAIGSIVIEGANNFGWEAQGQSGLVNASDPTFNQSPSFGNRKLVEFYKSEVVIGLRHADKLRRVVVGNSQGGILKLELLDGVVILLDTENGKNVLTIYRLNNVLEIRAEKLETDSISSTFSIVNSSL